MILAFKPQFVPRILSGRKIHDLREYKTKTFKPGTLIQMKTNNIIFKEVVCTSVQRIAIIKNRVCINGNHLNKQEVKTLAINSGFDGIVDFLKHTKNINGEFIGHIIHWTYLNY